MIKINDNHNFCWQILYFCSTVVDSTTAPRGIASKTRITKLPTKRAHLYGEVRIGDVTWKRPGRRGIVLRQATTTPAPASAASRATTISSRAGSGWLGERRRGRRKSRGSARFRGWQRDIRGIGQVRLQNMLRYNILFIVEQ